MQAKKIRRDIFEILKFNYLMSKLCLIAPYKIVGTIGNRTFIPIKNNDIIYVLKCMALSAALYICFYIFSRFGVLLRLSQALVNCLSVTLMTFCSFFRKKLAVKILKHFEQSEKFFCEHSILYSQKRLRNITIREFILIFAVSCYVLTVLTIEYLTRNYTISMYVLFFVPNTIIYCFLYQYYNFIFILEDWLESLKEYIENLYYVDENILESRLYVARTVYNSIYKMSQMVQIYYQIPLLCIKAGSFINTTAYSYLLYVSNGSIWSTYFWIFVNLLKLLFLSFVCQRCKNKVSEFILFLKNSFNNNSLKDLEVRYATRKLANIRCFTTTKIYNVSILLYNIVNFNTY